MGSDCLANISDSVCGQKCAFYGRFLVWQNFFIIVSIQAYAGTTHWKKVKKKPVLCKRALCSARHLQLAVAFLGLSGWAEATAAASSIVTVTTAIVTIWINTTWID